MGWFSPVKGSYPSLAQVDKTLPVSGEGVAKIQRGSIVALVEDSTGKYKDGVFKVASATDKILYVSLQDYTDPTAGFAGSAFDPKGGVPAITGIDLGQDGEYETSVFNTNLEYKVGDKLSVSQGIITKAGDGDTVIGFVTSPKKDRWVNNAIAVPNQENGPTDPRVAVRTGASLSVIRFKTAV